MSSCYPGNEEACKEYLPCLVLVQGKNVAISNEDTAPEDNNDEVTATEDSVVESTSTENTDTQNSVAANNTTNTTNNIVEASIPVAEDPVDPPIVPDQDIIEAPIISALAALWPEQDLTSLCSNTLISTIDGLEECERACQAGSCCNAKDNEPSFFSNSREICALYLPCVKVANLHQGGDIVGEEPMSSFSVEEEPQPLPVDEDEPQET